MQVKSIFKGIEVVPQIMIEILIFTLWQGNGQLLGRNFYLFGVEIVWDDQSRVTALFGRPNLVTGLDFVETGLIIVIHRSIILLGLDEATYFNLFNYALQLTDLIIQTIQLFYFIRIVCLYLLRYACLRHATHWQSQAGAQTLQIQPFDGRIKRN